MPFDPDFDSSDVEPPAIEQQEDDDIGTRALLRIAQSSEKDRLASKVALKTLQDTAWASTTTYARKYYYKLFTYFGKETLGIHMRPDTTPQGNDLLRFIERLPNYIVGRNPAAGNAMAFSTLQSAVRSLKHSLEFHFEEWKFARYFEIRLDALLVQLVKSGRVTKEQALERQWISCMMIKKMVIAILTDGIINGTRSWDILIHNCLGLVLQAALCSRTGDIRQGRGYEEPVHLRWEHITVKIQGTLADPKLHMIVKLLYEKGSKHDPDQFRVADFRSFDPGHNNVVDPIKLLLGLALRTGLVVGTSWEELGTSWEELVYNTVTGPGQTVLWRSPTSPVFFAMAGRHSRLDLTRPAGSNQQLGVLKHAADMIGMMTPPNTQDVRRGGGQNLEGLSLFTHNEGAARKGLGHRPGAADKGVTDRYAGRGAMVDTWKARIEHAEDPSTIQDEFGPQLALVPFTPERSTTFEITVTCKANGLDPNVELDRHKARLIRKKEQRSAWVEEQRKALATPGINVPVENSTKRKNEPSPSSPSQRTALKKIRRDVTETRPPLRPLDLNALSQARSDWMSLTEPVWMQSLDDQDTDEDGEVLSADTAVLGEFFGHSVPQESIAAGDVATINNKSLVKAGNELIEIDDDTEDSVTAVLFTDKTDVFMDFISQVNIVALQRHDTDVLDFGETGNSRAEPTRFMFLCQFSCGRESFMKYHIESHEALCQLNPDVNYQDVLSQIEEARLQVAVAGPVDAVARPTRQKKKPVPLEKTANGFSAQCPDRELCGKHQTFTNRNTYENHRTRFHSKWPHTSCQVDGRATTTVWKNRGDYRGHLKDVHKFSVDKINELLDGVKKAGDAVPPGTSALFVASRCLWPDCSDDRCFAKYKLFAKHMYEFHKATTAQLLAYLPTAEKHKSR